MSVGLALAGFLGGATVSLMTSFVLVARLERVGERLGLSEALLGVVAALAADAPEITAAFTAIAHHQQRIGAGVVIGSNVFNLAALLGLGALVAGRIGLHRKVVILGGAVAMAIAAVCLAVVLGVLPALAGLVLALVVLALYLLVLSHEWLGGLLPPRLVRWLQSAVSEEEVELEAAIRPARGTWKDTMIAAASLVVVVAASVTMERSASVLGGRYAVPEIVVGGLVLAAVTSLPNAVAAVYLAARGRGAATLSTALNSNTLNVVAGLLLPGVMIGLGRPSGQALLVTGWYAGLTAVVLAFAYRDHGLRRNVGILVIAAYAAFTASVLASGYGVPVSPAMIAGYGAMAAVVGIGLASRSLSGESLLPGWSVRRLLILGLSLSGLVAVVDAALGRRVVLIGLLIVGPCCALLTGRWILTCLTGLWVIALAVVLGVPDGIFGTPTHLAFLGGVAVVALASTIAAVAVRNART
ncbi:MAG TPA: hypothetical protein VMU94_23735 [Streptosporangiaceae bacterium]|nr:hypothetical protein [Streptosporangiaceae bacterium]